jgi:PST family polysaccharide transporter
VIVSFLEGTFAQSFPEALVRRKSVDGQHLDVCFWLTLGSACVAAVIVYLFSGVAAAAFHEPQAGPVLQWLALGIPLGALGRVHEALLRRELRFKQLAVRALVAILVSSAVAIWMAAAGFGVWALVAKGLSEAACGSAILWLSHPWRPRFDFSRRHLRDLLPFGLYLTGTRILELASQRLDTVVIGASLSSSQLAQYAIGQRLSDFLMETLHQSISTVSLPAFAALQDEAMRLRAAYLKTIRFTAFVAMPVFAIVAVLAQDIVLVLFGSQWQSAVPVLRVFAVGGVLFCFSYLVAPLLLAKGRADYYLWLVTLNVVLGIGFILAARWGIVAVAAALVIRGLLTSAVGAVLVRTTIGVELREVFRAVQGPAYLTIITAAALLLVARTEAIAGTTVSRLVLLPPLGVCSYLLAARVLTPRLLDEVLGTFVEFAPRAGALLKRI